MAQERVFGQRYRVLEVLGDGGMARVFKALDERLGRVVAIKTLHANFNNQSEFVSRFEKEAQFAASLSHPNIISVYDIGRDLDGTHYIVMEYVEGENLKSLIRREAPLPLPLTTAIVRQLCLALDYAHEQGVVHRDIKPENVFLTPTRRVKVGDFGIARALDSTGMTSTGQVLGSVSYFSPEQAQGQPATSQSDLYSVGIVIYEMVTRQVPFRAENALAVAMKHITEAPVPPSSLNARLTPGIDAVVLKAIAKDPARRYRTGAELAAALTREGSLAAPAVPVSPPTPPPASATRPPRPLAPSMAGAALAPRDLAASTAVALPPARAGGRPAMNGNRGSAPRASVALPPPRTRRGTLVPLLISLLLLAALAGGIVLGRNALQGLGGGAPSTSHGGGGAASSTPVPSNTASVGSGGGGGAVSQATATPTVPPNTATPGPATATPVAATRTPHPTATSTTAPLAHVQADLIIASSHSATYDPVGAADSFPGTTTQVDAIGHWQGAGAGHKVLFRWTLPNGDHGHWAPEKCTSQGGVCYVEILTPLPGLYRVHLYLDSRDVAHHTFTVSDGAPTATPPTQGAPPAASSTTTTQNTQGQQGGGQGNTVAVQPPPPTARVLGAVAGADVSAQVNAAVQYADNVYRAAMNTLDTSILTSAFGPYLVGQDAGQIAGYRARGVHLVTTPIRLVVQNVTPRGSDSAVASGYKRESAVLLNASGQIVQNFGTYTVAFTDVLQRVGGRWLVERFN